MRTKDIEAEALKLDPKTRAKLTGKLLESLENLSENENDALWADEAERRDATWEATKAKWRPASDVLREARERVK